jgi:hypothetical protein
MGRLDWFCKVERSSYIGVDDIACRTCCGGSAAIRLTFIDGTSTLLLALGPSRNFAKYCKDALLPRHFSKFSFLSDSTVSPCFHAFVTLRDVVALQRVLCQDFELLFPEAFFMRLSIMNILAKSNQ